ncbi:Zn-finger containing protein [Clostridium neonatale]|uniref:hypothetical protein n=1 Tax=Clostridium neonatale TaxID=137838 RepID=UPI00291B4389|nr:hypothetical protein [Clostridium neonatale]CAI3699405.1 Zn-finger containing protein [Clostridium neonatale]
MKNIYRIYKCKSCKREMILINDEAEKALNNGKYLSCAYCNCRHLSKEKETSDLRECMDHNAYKKVSGKVRQVHSI